MERTRARSASSSHRPPILPYPSLPPALPLISVSSLSLYLVPSRRVPRPPCSPRKPRSLPSVSFFSPSPPPPPPSASPAVSRLVSLLISRLFRRSDLRALATCLSAVTCSSASALYNGESALLKVPVAAHLSAKVLGQSVDVVVCRSARPLLSFLTIDDSSLSRLRSPATRRSSRTAGSSEMPLASTSVSCCFFPLLSRLHGR